MRGHYPDHHTTKLKLTPHFLQNNKRLTLSLPQLTMATCSVFLTFESVNEILWCDQSNETTSVVLLHGSICFLNIFLA